MDRVEDIERDRAGDQLSDRDVDAQRVSELETEKDMSAMMKAYDIVNTEGDDERSPPRLELAEQYRKYIYNKSTQFPPFAALSLLLRHPKHLLFLQWTSPVSPSGLCQ